MVCRLKNRMAEVHGERKVAHIMAVTNLSRKGGDRDKIIAFQVMSPMAHFQPGYKLNHKSTIVCITQSPSKHVRTFVCISDTNHKR